MAEIKIPKKLIEVALPLDIINKAAAREKSIRHGHPSTLHIWWARRPLAAARAVIFAQMVNDPGYERSLSRGVNKEKAQKERERLFGIIDRLVQWDNTNNPAVIQEARNEILKSWQETCELNKNHPEAMNLFNPKILPPLQDPFAGGGTIPLEAQRLGLETLASDLNPVPVLINKAMLEVPSRFTIRQSISSKRNPASNFDSELATNIHFSNDLKFYGGQLRDLVLRKTQQMYQDIQITEEMVSNRPDLAKYSGKQLKPLAYIWARTVKSPNPAFSHIDVPLTSSFVLATKPGKEAYIEPIIGQNSYSFKVVKGKVPKTAKGGTKTSRGANFECIMSRTPIEPEYIRKQFVTRKASVRLMAIVLQGNSERVYLDPIPEVENIALEVKASWRPDIPMNKESKDLVSGRGYGIEKWDQIFTERQLVLLDELTKSVKDIVAQIELDALNSGQFDEDNRSFVNGGAGAKAYSEALGIYLGLATSKFADNNSTACTWMSGVKYEVVRNAFSRQALPMTWDFAEPNPFAGSSGDFFQQVERMAKVCEISLCFGSNKARAYQESAMSLEGTAKRIFSTDPPYYDNIAYADLSDFFYIWLRKALYPLLGESLESPETPKNDELVALAYRHGGKLAAEKFFLTQMSNVLARIRDVSHPAFPVTIYYAFKQAEIEEEGIASTGWNTFLTAIIDSGYEITGTWPMRTERSARTVSIGTNTLASSVILVCRTRNKKAPTISRREFIRELNASLPEALEEMTTGSDASPIAPVDFSQAIIGPGMSIFSRYSAVLEADGKPMTVKTALQLINRFLAEDDYDLDTQFCLHWFEAYGWDSKNYGEADVLARAKGTSVETLAENGIVRSVNGKLCLLRPKDLPSTWTPENEKRLSIWEVLHHMIRAFHHSGEDGAGEILAKTERYSEAMRTLAYRLYTTCERKGWSQEATTYNSLIISWENIESSAQSVGYSGTQIPLFNDGSEINKETPKGKSKARKKS